MIDRGRINSDVLSSFENYRGVNKLALSVGHSSHRLTALWEQARDDKDWAKADELRAIRADLDDALEYLGIVYTPPQPSGESKG